MAKSANTQEWFQFAREELLVATMLNESKEPKVWRHVAYHSEQAAEKAIKGFLTYRKVPFTKTHDIGGLAIKVLKFNTELDSLMRRASTLTKFAISYRYPDAVPPEELTAVIVAEALACAKEVLETMATLIPFDSRFEV